MRTILLAALVVYAAPAMAQDPAPAPAPTTGSAQPGTPTSIPPQAPNDPTSQPDEADGTQPARTQPTGSQPGGGTFPASPPQAPNDPTSQPDEADPMNPPNAPPIPQGPSTADPVVKPDAPTPEVPNPAEDVRTYAGVGSDTAYAERGVAELGGSAGVSLAQNVVQISADPQIGYFLWDNVELSGLIGVRHASVDGSSSNQYSLLVEPSVHFPINDGLFVAGGVGAGAALLDTTATELDVGFALAPRVGVQFLLGRSGLLNVGARYAAVFSSAEVVGTIEEGATVLAFQNTLDLQAGYTIMF